MWVLRNMTCVVASDSDGDWLLSFQRLRERVDKIEAFCSISGASEVLLDCTSGVYASVFDVNNPFFDCRI